MCIALFGAVVLCCETTPISDDNALLALFARSPFTLLFALVLVKLQNTYKKQKNAWKTQHMLYSLKAGGSMMSNMTFLCVNPIELISGEIPEILG